MDAVLQVVQCSSHNQNKESQDGTVFGHVKLVPSKTDIKELLNNSRSEGIYRTRLNTGTQLEALASTFGERQAPEFV